MRIAHVITRLLRAGSEENTLLTCAGQIAAGHEVFVLHGREAMPAYAQGMAPGVGLIEVPALERELAPATDLRAFRQIRTILSALRPDVVHTHQSKAGIVGRLAAAAAGTWTVVHGVHILPFLGESGVKRAIYLGAEKLAARSTDAFVHVSAGMLTACRAHGIGADRIHRVVHSGFDVGRFAGAEPPEDWRRLLGLDHAAPKPPVVVMLASLEERKQHLPLIERLPPLLRAFPDAQVLFAGEGPLKGAIERRIAERGLGDRVRLLGYRSDPERVIALADVCILSSRREGLPRSVMQYVAAGRPAVVFRFEGIERLVADGRNGRVVEQDDWDGFVAAVAGALADADLRAAFAREARAVDLSPWDASHMAGRTLAVYEEASAAARGRRGRTATPRGGV